MKILVKQHRPYNRGMHCIVLREDCMIQGVKRKSLLRILANLANAVREGKLHKDLDLVDLKKIAYRCRRANEQELIKGF